MNHSYRYIGKTIARRDAYGIVTGEIKYLNDFKFPDLLYARVLRSPHPHALIRHINKDKAVALKGVHAVLTWQDIGNIKGGIPPITPVLDSKVRYVGDAVAIVAATSEAIADEAIRRIQVEYEILPAVYDIEEALKPGAPQIYDESPGNVTATKFPAFGPRCLTEIKTGDISKGFSEADVIAEGTFKYENIPNPLPPEPPGVVALWDESNNLTVWVSNQSPTMDHARINRMFGKQAKVRVHAGICGGSYGSKVMSWQIQCYAILLSRETQRPVKLILTKEEHLATFVLRPGSRMRARVGMKKDGTVTAVSGNWLVNTGFHSSITQAQVAVGCGEAQIAIRCPNWDLKTTIGYSNRAASGIVRGFGGQELKCTLLPLLSQAMAKVKADPFEVLKKNYLKPGDDYFWRDGNRYTYRGVDYTPSMDKGAERFRWKEKWKGWLKPSLTDGRKRWGIGVGVHGNADIGEDASEVYVRLHSDGTAIIISSLTEHGTGQISNYIKMVAEVLQLPLARVSMTPVDTLFTAHEQGPVGSRGTYAIGSAMIAAAEDALKKLFGLLASKLGGEVKELMTKDGQVFCKNNPEQKVSWEAMGMDKTLTGFGRFDPDYTLVNCMMTFVEVAVDMETGLVELIQVVNSTDVGKIIDPQGLEGQLNGCLGSAGIDSALFEETVLDPTTGHILNANLIDYKWRTFSELPDIHNVVLETPFPSHRFHAVGVGEIATSPGPSAVLMAVSNAIGKWLFEYPVTPERILKVIGNDTQQTRK